MDMRKVKPLGGCFRGFHLPSVPGVLKPAALLLAAISISGAFTLEGHPGTPLTPSAQPLGRMGLAIGLAANGHADADLVRDKTFLFQSLAPPTKLPDTAGIEDLQSGTLRINAVLGVAQWLDIGISVPMFFDLISDTRAEELSGAGIGDPVLSAKAGFAVAGDHVFDLGLLAGVSLPSKNSEGFLPKHTGGIVGDDTTLNPPRFFSSYGTGWSARALATVDLTRLEYTIPFRVNIGAGLKNAGMGGNRFLLGGGVEWIPVPFLGFFGELQTETRADGIGKFLGKDLMIASVGFQATSSDGMFVNVGVHRRITAPHFRPYAKVIGDSISIFSAGTQPEFGLAISLGWSGAMVEQDLDRDGIPDKQDPCPNDAEDKDGFQDFDGCPERDNDEDGIIDAADKCPIEPEDKDGFEDQDGCPDHDNDGDNIPDALDKCPIEPEDVDGFEDYDGCPDLDNDQDGVLDQQDKCPAQPEDKDGFEDQDGCPDPDNDGDKIPDGADKCPLEPETYNNFEDGDGCPDIVRQGGALLEARSVLRGVRFRANTTELLASSYPALDTLAAKLKASPGTLVEIRAYIDKAGTELEQYRVTEAWASTVRKYLITLGVPANQVLSRGMGARDPVAPNTTSANRAKNRRVEAIRLN